LNMQQGGGGVEERIFSPNTEALERGRGTKTEGPAPHELLENSELTNSLARTEGATRVAGAGKGGKMGREADLIREDAGSVFKQLDDPPPGEERPKNTPGDISGDISGRSLDGRETLDLGRKRPNQRPVRLRPRPNLAIQPRTFLAARPNTCDTYHHSIGDAMAH